MAIDPQLLEILACPVPKCRAALSQHDAALVCSGCGRRYRIEQSWPVLIPEEAEMPGGTSADRAIVAETDAASKKS